MMCGPAMAARAMLMLTMCASPPHALAGDAAPSLPAASTASPSSSLPATSTARSAVVALLAKPVTLRGKIGTESIEMHLQMKVPADEGIEGDYLVAGKARKILLAGESENDNLSLEESENGSDISGLWEGIIDGRTIRGTWTSADASIAKPFELTTVPGPAVAGKPVSSKKRLKLAVRDPANLP